MRNPGKMTPARASKLRTMAMKACGCWLCAHALNPPKTFEEHARYMEATALWYEANQLGKAGSAHGADSLAHTQAA